MFSLAARESGDYTAFRMMQFEFLDAGLRMLVSDQALCDTSTSQCAHVNMRMVPLVVWRLSSGPVKNK
jgi:hypothetical protein